MLKFIAKRILISLGLLIAFSFVMYGIIFLMMYTRTGFRWPFFATYFSYVLEVFRGGLGWSTMARRPVTDVIADSMWTSFTIVLTGVTIAYLIAIPLGIRSAIYKNSAFDNSVSILSTIGISFPMFFWGAIFIRVFSVQLGWFPASGMISNYLPHDVSRAHIFFNRIWHLILPVMIMIILNIGALLRYTRTSMIEALSSNYIQTHKVYGINRNAIINKFAFKNTAAPISTHMGRMLPTIFAGAMIIEVIFAIDGIGFVAFRALIAGDIALIMGINMFLGVLAILGSLLSDIGYAVLDPRIRIS